ncbi:DUF6115 domain-containing protein [Lentibacillus salinarum]|uniref:DUF6115 domain-containing protein n=1 Tax=Lentibacillus salinarum TaxID=446820 RepID=A0ABW3ZRE2_9BACI
MTSILIFLSLLLHVVTLSIILHLFKQVKRLKQTNSGEIAELMETYLQDIKEENRQLENTLVNKSGYSELAAREGNDRQREKVEDHDMAEINHVTDETSFSLEAQILQLNGQGLNAEEIARQLNCGKTEAELILKLQKNAYNNP